MLKWFRRLIRGRCRWLEKHAGSGGTMRAQGAEPMRDSVANDTLSALALKYGLDLGDSAASRAVQPFEAMHPVVSVTARAVVLRADDARLVLAPDTARWLAHALLRAVLSPDGDLVAARDGVLVGAHLLNLPSGAPAVVITERGLFVLTEACALALSLVLLDAAELVAPAPAPVVLVMSDIARQVAYPA